MSIAETIVNVFTDQVNASWYADEDDNVELELRVADLLEMNWVPGYRPLRTRRAFGLETVLVNESVHTSSSRHTDI